MKDSNSALRATGCVARWWDRLRKIEKMEIIGLDIDVGPMNWARLPYDVRRMAAMEYVERCRPSRVRSMR